MNQLNDRIRAKMESAGVGRPTIDAFLNSVAKVRQGDRGMLPEDSLQPVEQLPVLQDLPEDWTSGREWLDQLAVVKLNGGLGTSMGLERAKSLLAVKGADTFLDFTARQVLHLRESTRSAAPAFYLMNSFVTRQDTLQYLAKYPALAEDGELDFLQNKVPKIDAQSLEPMDWPSQPDLEWCPPGHGDLYASLLGSGLLDRLLRRGIQFLFVSNSDNLGATVDLRLLRYFAKSENSFLMEVAERTTVDRKGGHLAKARATGRLLLRESAQCPRADAAAFQDIDRHRFFNTNNLWLRLPDLKAKLDQAGGALPLPLITNTKTVDPKDPASPKVLQLESAMGAAIECFERSGALLVPRTRFAPVKTTSDLLALRSDAYHVTPDWRLELAEPRRGQPPHIDLDSEHCKILSDFDQAFGEDVPSLLACDAFKTVGPIRFARGVVCEGKVEFVNPSPELRTVPAGRYRDTRLTF